FIFPSVPQYGYDELLELGETTNDVFSGPILKNGWIRNEELGDKKNCVRLVDINGLVNSVEGVIPSAILTFDGNLAAKDMSSEDYEILVFDVLDDLKQSRLSIYCNNTKVENKALQNAIAYAERAIKSEKNFSGVTTVKTKPKLPKGAYRDIETYYSIQNTFPSIFGVGEHSVKSNASNFEIAQSRQLKGYLTLFDQILANQFSQLANIDKLFSFKNNLTGATSDFERFYAKRDTFDKKHPGFPAPYELFSATYFYQSLYNVPYIRPLLKDNEKFDFSFTPESDKVAQENSWKEYKDDPYNPYMWALLTHTADDKTNYQRRDTLLDHLLARHGESPEVINLLIEGTTYTLDPVMDRVIIKSLLLQNLEKLSYNAPKGYNYLAADSLQFKVVGDFRELLMPVPPYRYTKDFIFRSKKVDHIEKINPQDVINCSSFELKLNLLFGLRVKYSDFYVANFDQHEVNEELALSQWFMNARRGAIVLETNLLFLPAQFQLAITSADEPDTFYYSQTGLTFDEAILIGNSINFAMDEELTKHVTKGSITVQNKLYPISKEENKDWPKHWFRPTQQGGYRVAIEVRWDDQTFTYIKDPKFNDNLDVFFPTFISEMGSQAFINKFDLLAENSLPISLRANYYFKDTVWFMTFIPIWVKWLNSMRYKSDSENDSTVLLKNTTLLASQIIKLPIRYND
ncbi:MAG: hypothetical protein K0U54_07280, partial [Bacteroidetes bacterium]|nr:hypothetical protein [Bacteroidota bacterium]